MRVASKNGGPKTLHRPLQHVYPLKVCDDALSDAHPDRDIMTCQPADVGVDVPTSTAPDNSNSASRRPRRAAAVHARDRILGCLTDD